MADLMFHENFWGKDAQENDWGNSYPGYDVLVRRMHESKSFCETFIEYQAKRAQIEKAYGDALIRLATTVHHKDTVGDLRRAWDTMIFATQEMGKTHLELAKTITTERIPSFRDFATQTRAARKAAESSMKKQMDTRASVHNKIQRQRKEYETKCKEHDQLKAIVEYPPATARPKDMEKARAKFDKVIAQRNAADTGYQEGVRLLDGVRVDWERTLEATAQTFQALEEKRIDRLKEEMWHVANQNIEVARADTHQFTELQAALERVHVGEEVRQFVAEKGTGNIRPAPIPYFNFYTNAPTYLQSPAAQRANSLHTSRSGGINGSASGVPLSSSSVGRLSSNSTSNTNMSASHSIYPSVSRQGETCRFLTLGTPADRCKYDYEAQSEYELSYHVGDLVTVTSKEEDPWWEGIINNKKGMVYKDFVEIVKP